MADSNPHAPEPPESAASIALFTRVIVSVVALGGLLYWLRPMLVPLVLAMALAIGLTPLVRWLRRHSVSQRLAVGLTLLLGVGLLAGTGILVTLSVAQMAEKAPAYEEKLSAMIDEGAETVRGWGLDVGRAPVKAIRKDLPLKAWLRRAASGTASLVGNAFLVFVFLIYLLGSARGPDEEVDGVRGRIQARVQRYLLAKSLISLMIGVATGLVVWILGGPMPLVFGVLAFLLDFVPQIGSMLAGLLPVAAMVLTPDIAVWQVGVAAGVLLVIHAGSGNFINPKVLGDALKLRPIVVILALIFWGMLWGPVGALLAAPLTGVVKILLADVPSLRPLAQVLGELEAGEATP